MKRNIESASVFQRSGIQAICARAIEVLLYLQYVPICTHFSRVPVALIRILYEVEEQRQNCYMPKYRAWPD